MISPSTRRATTQLLCCKPQITLIKLSPYQSFSTSSILRAASSSSASSPSTTNPPTTVTPTSTSTTSPAINWNDFLKLRKLRRRYNLVGSIATSMVTTTVGLRVLGQQEIEMSQMIWGMDPLMVLGFGLISCGAAGWLAGPVLGSVAFRMANSKYLPEIAKKEKEFFDHIKKNRVDPSFQSFSNPVPDYYGEKIGSLQQYRQWLKDQRAYNRKRAKFL